MYIFCIIVNILQQLYQVNYGFGDEKLTMMVDGVKVKCTAKTNTSKPKFHSYIQ